MAAPRVGITFYNITTFLKGSGKEVLEFAREIDAKGIDVISVVDHVAIANATYEKAAAGEGDYPLGKEVTPGPPDEPIFEAMCLLSAIGAVTKNATLSMYILVGPLRSSVLLAKQAATIDVLSGGRLELALGAGWQAEEFRASNVPFVGRFGILEEQIDICRKLWREAPVSYAGRHTSFDGIWSFPQPLRKEIFTWLGLKATERNSARIARLADGWIPDYSTVEILEEGMDRIRHECRKIGRDPTGFPVRSSPSNAFDAEGNYDLDAALATAPGLLAAGATEFTLNVTSGINDEAALWKAVEYLTDLKR